MFKHRSVSGLTLLECMLALILSLFLLGIVFEVYLVAVHNQLFQMTLISMQENADNANALLTRAVRMAGARGCAILTGESGVEKNLNDKITPYYAPEIKKDSDALTVWYLNLHHGSLLSTMRGHATLYISRSPLFAVGDRLVISDCKTTELFTVKQVEILSDGRQKLTSLQPLNTLFQAHAELNKLEQDSYFLANTKRLTENHQPIYALYLKNNQGQKAELVEGIDTMKINYVLNKHTHRLDESNLTAVSFQFRFSSVTHFAVQKIGYLYVALR